MMNLDAPEQAVAWATKAGHAASGLMDVAGGAWPAVAGNWPVSLYVALAATVVAAVLGLRWLNAMLQQWRGVQQVALDQGLKDAFVWLAAERLVDVATLAMVVPGAFLLLSGLQPLLGLGLVVTGLAAPRLGLAWLRKRRMQTLREQLPDAIQLLAGSLRAGLGLNSALAMLAGQTAKPAADEFALLVRQQRLGASLTSAMDLFEARVRVEEAAMFAAALRTASMTGGNLADTLDRVAATLRERLAIEGKIDALTAQGRLQGWVVGALPFALIPVLYQLDADAVRPLWQTPAGWAVLAGVSLMVSFGMAWIRKIVGIDV